MKCQSLFSGKIRIIINLSSAEFAQRVVKVDGKIPNIKLFSKGTVVIPFYFI